MNIKPLPPDTPIPSRTAAPVQSLEKKAGRPLGSHSESVRAHEGEKEKRVLEVAALILEFKTVGKIKKQIAEKYGLVPRSVEEYIRAARVMLRDEGETTKDDLRTLISNKYHEIIAQTNVTDTKNQLIALRQFADLHGLNLHVVKVAATNQEGKDIAPGDTGATPTPVLSIDPRKALADLLSNIVVDGEHVAQLELPSPGQSIVPVSSP